jgi:hypothetical protein
MYVSAHDDSSSLLPIGDRQVALFPGTAQVATEQVTVRTLKDELGAEPLPRPALLKLDVQGFELPALQGCEDMLDRFDSIYVEASLEELYDGQALLGDLVVWLGERGFQLADIAGIYRDKGKAIQGDFLFARKTG